MGELWWGALFLGAVINLAVYWGGVGAWGMWGAGRATAQYTRFGGAVLGVRVKARARDRGLEAMDMSAFYGFAPSGSGESGVWGE